MKKIFALLLAVVMTLGLLAGCGTAAETPDTEAPATEAPAAEEPAAEPTAKKIDTLKVAFVPSREPQEIITVTEPLKEMLKNELAALGYEVGEVEITVGTTYEAVGEGLKPARSTSASSPAAPTFSMTTAPRSFSPPPATV